MVGDSSSGRGLVHGVVTNVITGFLGAGKSTAILHLLRHKPEDERWAVLVNEFGEVGIDGSFMQGRESEEPGIFVREVPGGCMCCASGLPMQMALTMLLAHARPQRLLIEPTGLGHPQEVLDLLTADQYQEVLDVQATITLVDARKIHDRRYTEHPTYLQQLAVADVIVANKVDQYSDEDLPALQRFLSDTAGLDSKPLFEVEQGALQLDWLATPAGHPAGHHHHGHDHSHSHGSAQSQIPATPEIPEAGFLRIDNEGEGYFSRGWVFDPAWTFDDNKLYAWLLGVEAERVKGVFITDQGVSAYNMVDAVITKLPLSESLDSRVEIISSDRGSFAGLEEALFDCVLSR